jgi:hypothetical protein
MAEQVEKDHAVALGHEACREVSVHQRIEQEPMQEHAGDACISVRNRLFSRTFVM